mmetsp:Transcript_8129/g.16988  ORF Transcript_8129/g.16988 Transcript_8129/m.16988 type:complete len:471 (-) Transcript_8129:159-1571(-)
MVRSKTRAAGLPPLSPGAEQAANGVTAAKASRIADQKAGSTGEATRNGIPSTVESRSDQSCHAPSVSASAMTEGTQRSAVRVTRSSGMRKSKSKKDSATSKKTHKPTTSTSKGKPTEKSSSNGATAAVKKQRAKSPVGTRAKSPLRKKLTAANTKKQGDGKGKAAGVAVATVAAAAAAEPKTGGVLKGCVTGDNEREGAMENGTADDADANTGGCDGDKAVQPIPTTLTEIFSVGSLDMMHTKLTESYRSFEDSAITMKDSVVFGKELQDFGRDASEWGENRRVECTESLIPMLLADGKSFIAQAIGGCGAVVGAALASRSETKDENMEEKVDEVADDETNTPIENKAVEGEEASVDGVREEPIASKLRENEENPEAGGEKKENDEPQDDEKEEDGEEDTPVDNSVHNGSDSSIPMIEPITPISREINDMPAELGQEVEQEKPGEEAEDETPGPSAQRSTMSRVWRFSKK